MTLIFLDDFEVPSLSLHLSTRVYDQPESGCGVILSRLFVVHPCIWRKG